MPASTGVKIDTITTVVDGAEVTYYASIEDHDRNDVLVLMHGTAGSTAAHFGFLLPILAARQRVVAIDWAPPVTGGPLQLEQLERQLAAVLREVGQGRTVTLLGYSLGAVVALSTAAHHPELVDQLIVVAGWLKTDLQQLLRNDVWQALRASDPDGSQALRAYTVFCAFGGPFLGTRSLPDLQPAMDAMSFDAFGDAQMELNRRIDLCSAAEAIAATTLVVGCTHDQMVPVRHSKAIFGAIEDSRYVEIATGHAAVFERPSELCDVIQTFVDDPNAYPAGAIIPRPTP